MYRRKIASQYEWKALKKMYSKMGVNRNPLNHKDFLEIKLDIRIWLK